MKRRVVLTLVACSLLAATTSFAGWNDFWYRVEVDFHRMNCWPEPFQHADRQLAITPLIAMTDAGWRQQNTLSDHFFEVEDQSLTQSGQLKVHWIATQAPSHRRTVFVLRGGTPQVSVKRVESVQKFIEKIAPALRPEVLLTDAVPPGGSGEYYEAVDRQRKTSIPAPRLPEMQEQTSGS
jgi:hypothetical protein